MKASPAPNDGMGSLLYSNNLCRFRVWAPFASLVQVAGEFPDSPIDLIREDSGNWAGVVSEVGNGAKYQYLITNVGGPGNDNSQIWTRADARALQVENSNPAAKSFVVDQSQNSERPEFNPPAFEDYLIYQLHIGSFVGLNDVPPIQVNDGIATFEQVAQRLQYIKDLGFTAIQPLPIGNTLIGQNGIGEGYATSDMFAPESSYGTTPGSAAADLTAFIDAAHKIGLAVILDVVYGHSARLDNRYWQYDGNAYGSSGGGIYFEGGVDDTGFGAGFAFWKREVKDFFLDNARLWLEYYRVDGLRFDASQLIPTDGIKYITGSLRPTYANRYLIAEYNPNDPHKADPAADPFLDLGFSATWDLDSPFAGYALLSGDDPVDNLVKLIGGFQNPAPWCLIRYLAGSHDEIYFDGSQGLSNRYLVERLGGRGNGWALAKARLAWALNVALPGTPMLFMGTEGQFDGYWNPDGQGERRFDWAIVGDPIGSPMQRMVREVNQIRLSHPALKSPTGEILHVDRTNQVVGFKRYNLEGDVILIVANVGDNHFENHAYGISMGGESGTYNEIFNSQSPEYGGVNTTGNFGDDLQVDGGLLQINLPSWSVLMFRKQ